MYQLWEVVRPEDRETVVHADRKRRMMEGGGLQSKRPKMQTTKSNAKKGEEVKLKKIGMTPETNHINIKVTTDTHLIHINLNSLTSPTGVTYTCNM